MTETEEDEELTKLEPYGFYYDDREKSEERRIEAESNGFVRAHLAAGDYVHGICAIEYKSEDFIMFSKEESVNLFIQIERIKSMYPKFGLVVAKPLIYYINQCKIRGILVEVLDGFIASCWEHGFTPLFAHDDNRAIHIIKSMLMKANDGKDRSNPFAMGGKRSFDLRMFQLKNLNSLPGISITTAALILDHYKTVRNFYSTTIEELKSVKGIGDKRATEIMRVLDSNYVGTKENPGE